MVCANAWMNAPTGFRVENGTVVDLRNGVAKVVQECEFDVDVLRGEDGQGGRHHERDLDGGRVEVAGVQVAELAVERRRDRVLRRCAVVGDQPGEMTVEGMEKVIKPLIGA